MVNSDCKIYYKSEFVSWTIKKENIEKTLIGNSEKTGLLYLKFESAGEINFKDNSCKINTKSEKVCNKKMSSNLKFKYGDKDSVMTPISVVNFHTHPITCYIDAETIWGWPSGEDLGQCINFANDNNLTHIIFAIEGTYVIDFNKIILNYLKINKNLLNLVKNNIEEIFKLTHKYRMYYNDTNDKINLDIEFNEIFLKPINLIKKENIILSWVNLINNLTLENLIILSNQFNKYFKNIKKIKLMKIDYKYLNIKLYTVTFIKNKTAQWDKSLSNIEKFKLISNKKKFKIVLPEEINYKAPFISENCKLI